MRGTVAKRFGKYILLDHLAKGGMADLYRAKVTGVEKFERLLAIKCMRAELASDQQFVSMFVNEANLAGQLTHPNIAQIYELGRFRDQFYIAMELVEGRDLRNILNRCVERSIQLPHAFVAYVVTKAAYGLHYAHTKANPQGEALRLVHRDVSPPNILISFSGDVKVVDFGIAKAAHGSHNETRAGVLKGKFAYMAPEQVLGKPVDHRTDIFTLGIVLYELLTSKRLFEADNDFELLQKVQSVQIPDLRATLPDVPPELIRVLYNALARNPDDRYKSAAALAKDLEPLLIVDRTIYGLAEAEAFMATLYDPEERKPPVYGELAPEDIEEPSFTPSTTNTFLSAFDDDLEEKPLWKVSTQELEVGNLNLHDDEYADPEEDDELAASDDWTQHTREVPRGKPEARGETASAKLVRAFSENSKMSSVGVLLLVLMGLGLGLFFGVPLLTRHKSNRDSQLAQKKIEKNRDERDRGFGYLDVNVRGLKGAKVLVDGHPVGTAPIKGLKLRIGQHTIKVVDPARKKRLRSSKINIGKDNPRKRPLVVRVNF